MKYKHVMRVDGLQSTVECDEVVGEEGWCLL